MLDIKMCLTPLLFCLMANRINYNKIKNLQMVELKIADLLAFFGRTVYNINSYVYSERRSVYGN